MSIYFCDNCNEYHDKDNTLPSHDMSKCMDSIDTLETLVDIRRVLKPIGFTVKTKKLSWGRHATYVHIESGQELSFNVFTPELLEKWSPLLDWRKCFNEDLKQVRDNEDCLGLV